MRSVQARLIRARLLLQLLFEFGPDGNDLDGGFAGVDLSGRGLILCRAEHKWDRKKARTKDFGVALLVCLWYSIQIKALS